MADIEQKISDLEEGLDSELDGDADFAADAGTEKVTKKFNFTQIVKQAMTNSPLAAILPADASETNKLVTHNYVDSDIGTKLYATATGGNFASLSALNSGAWYDGGGKSVTPKNYQFANINEDTLHGGHKTRYYWTDGAWVFDDVEKVNLTDEQQWALDSTITKTKVEQLPSDGGLAANDLQLVTTAMPDDTDAGDSNIHSLQTILQFIWDKIQGIRDNFARKLQTYDNVNPDDTDAAAVTNADTNVILKSLAKKINGIRSMYARTDGVIFTGDVLLNSEATENLQAVPLQQLSGIVDGKADEEQNVLAAFPDDTDAGATGTVTVPGFFKKVWDKIQGIRDNFARKEQNLSNVAPDDTDVSAITNTDISTIFSVLGKKINGVRNNYARKDGVRFTGDVVLNEDAAEDLGAVTLQQLNAAIAGGLNTDQNLTVAVPDDTDAGATGTIHLSVLLQTIWNKIQGIRNNFFRKLQSYNMVTPDDTDADVVTNIDANLILQSHAQKINGIREGYARLDKAEFTGEVVLADDAYEDLSPVSLQQMTASLLLKADQAQGVSSATPDDTDASATSTTAPSLLQKIWNKIQGIRDNYARHLQSYTDVSADDTNAFAMSDVGTEALFSFLAKKINGIRNAYARKDGATYTGDIVLAGDATDDLNPVPLQQAQDLLSYKVTGSQSAVEDNLPIYDGTTGRLIKDSGYSLNDLIKYTDIVNDLTTGGEFVPGSAEQLKVLDAKIVQAMQQGVYRGRVLNALVSQKNTYQIQPGYTISNAGTGYMVGDSIQYSGTDLDEIDALFVVASTGSGGTVTSLTMSNPGSFNADKTGIITPQTGGSGINLQLNVTTALAPSTTLNSITSPQPNNFAGVMQDEGRGGAAYMWIMGDFNGDGIYNWVRGYPLGQVERNFFADPIVADELDTAAATDVKIGTRTLADSAADSAIVPITAKYLTAWLQGIRNNLKALFSFFSSSGVANSTAKLDTARNIGIAGDVTGSQSFDGSADITISSTIANNAVTGVKILNGVVDDDKIGTRTLSDSSPDPILVPVTAKNLTAWLQGIRNNMKALFEYLSVPVVTQVTFDNDTVELATIIYITANKNISSIGMYTAVGAAIPGVPTISGTTASFIPNSQGVFTKAFTVRIT
jgi:hypothetical protein